MHGRQQLWVGSSECKHTTLMKSSSDYRECTLVWSLFGNIRRRQKEKLCVPFFSKLISLALKRGRWLIWTRTSIISDTTHSLSSFALVFLKLHWSLREETLLEKWISFAYLFPCKNKVQQNLILKEKSFAYKNLH